MIARSAAATAKDSASLIADHCGRAGLTAIDTKEKRHHTASEILVKLKSRACTAGAIIPTSAPRTRMFRLTIGCSVAGVPRYR